MKIVIEGDFPSLNEYIAASKRRYRNWNGGNEMKQEAQRRIIKQLPKVKFKKPIKLHYTYFCANRRRDLDNISGFFHKVFQDSLVEAGIIPDDNWQYITGFSDSFTLDRKRPRIEIEIEVIE